MVVVRSSRFSPLGWWHTWDTARVHGLPVPRPVSPLVWWRARAMARAAGLPVRRHRLTAATLGGVRYQMRLAEETSSTCPMVWWVYDKYVLRLTLRRSPDSSSKLWPALVWGAELNLWPRTEVVLHPTAEAAAADLMDRYMSPDDSSAARVGFLASAFGGASPEHLEERAKAVLREANAEKLRPPTDG